VSRSTTVSAVRHRLSRLAKVAFSAVVLAVLIRRIEPDAMRAALGSVRPEMFLFALGCYVTGHLLSARKWLLIGRALGFRRPYREYARFYFIGMFVNLLGPSTVGGDLTRAVSLGNGERRALAVASVLFDRASGLVVLVTIGLVGLVAFPYYPLPPLLGVLAAGIVVVLGVSWWVIPRAARMLLPGGHRLQQLIQDDLHPIWSHPSLLATVAVTAAAFHMTEVSAQYLLARALGHPVPFSYCLILHPAVTVLTAAVPVSVAGLGVREGGYVFFLRHLGVPEASALAFGLLWSAMIVTGALSGGALLLWGGTPRRGRPGRRPPRTSRDDRGHDTEVDER
jgi:hypothetical protein